MDAEYRLKVLEEEMRHEQAMAQLRGERLDAHDRSIEALREMLGHLIAQVDKTQAMLQSLIQIIAAEHANGEKK